MSLQDQFVPDELNESLLHHMNQDNCEEEDLATMLGVIQYGAYNDTYEPSYCGGDNEQYDELIEPYSEYGEDFEETPFFEKTNRQTGIRKVVF